MGSRINKRPQVVTRPSGIDKLWLVAIAVLAACVRIIFVLQSADDPFRGLLFLDAKVYHLLAVEIATRSFWGSEVFFRAPLFPYVLGLVYKIFGVGGIAIQILHSALGIGTTLLTYLIAEFHFDRRIARIAGICAAVYPTLYFFELTLMPTALEVFTFTAAIYCFSRYERSRSTLSLMLAGFALALAALARPTILSFLIVLPLWFWLVDKGQRWKNVVTKMAWVILPMIIVILPVTIRNYMIESDLVLISSQGGANFYIGNNPYSDGQTVAFPFGQAPLNRYEDHIWSASKFIAEKRTHQKLTSAEISSYWFKQGKSFVAERPGDAIGLFLEKSYLSFCGEELFNNANPLMPRQYSLLYAMSIWHEGINFPFGLIAPLFLIGSVMLLRQKNKRSLLLFFVFSQVITLSVFFVSSRFRQSLLPVMLVVAGYAGYMLYQWLRFRNWRSLTGYGVSFVLLVVAFNPPFKVASRQNQSMYHALLGGALASRERYEEAVEQLRESIRIADDNATAFQLLGSLYVKSGQIEQALAVLHRAEELAPDAIQTKSVLSRIYYDRKDFQRALNYFESVLGAGVQMEKFNFWAARSAFELGQFNVAQRYVNAALAENPADNESIRLAELIKNKAAANAPE